MLRLAYLPLALLLCLASTGCATTDEVTDAAATETVDPAEETGDAAQRAADTADTAADATARAAGSTARAAADVTIEVGDEVADPFVMSAEAVAGLAEDAWREARGALGMDGVADDARVAVAQVMTPGGATNDVRGTVTFVETADGVRARYDLAGLSPGRHGFHVHAGPSCAAADVDGDGSMEAGGAAGAHLDPGDNPHGAPTDPMGEKHAGDLGNVMVMADGEADGDVTVASLAFEGERSVLNRTIVVHAEADEFADAGAMAGNRVGCGVIRLARRSM